MRLARSDRFDHRFIEPVRVRIKSRGRAGFQPVTEIAAGDKRDGPSQGSDRLADAIAKAQVVFVRKEAVAERYNFAVPTVALKEIERHRRTMIEIASDSQRNQAVPFGRTSDLI